MRRQRTKWPTKRVHVGHTDCTPLNAKESGLGRPCKSRRFFSIEDAEDFIETLSKQKQFFLMVYNGDYYIDHPEI